MKKTSRSKLALTREHIRVLTPAILAHVAGGAPRETTSDACCEKSDSCQGTGTGTQGSDAADVSCH